MSKSTKPIDILSKYMGPLADMRRRAQTGICPFCNTKIELNDFRDELSFREFEISGLCQVCQDKTFKDSDD